MFIVVPFEGGIELVFGGSIPIRLRGIESVGVQFGSQPMSVTVPGVQGGSGTTEPVEIESAMMWAIWLKGSAGAAAAGPASAVTAAAASSAVTVRLGVLCMLTPSVCGTARFSI
ncbi:hypothetical protein [Nocardia wallacei]|uniref:hypothetical protein n=1 Tax=Nocardia wallacei TaxID=480035 RepID=UPI001657620F|nr:hypothetical protein [Nocardia wallacei]